MHVHEFKPHSIVGPEVVYKCSCGEVKRELREKPQKKKTLIKKILRR